MSNLSDAQLLHLTSSGDDAQRRSALEALVRRELDFVYAAAVRQANFDRHLAQDITQAVFILLARKAGKLRHDVILRDWLFVTTRYAARNALKIEARRRYHERRAAAERSHAIDSNDVAPLRERLAPLIDEAVARLSSADRAGVLLNFFDNKTYREVGEQLGVSEEAARKRVGRAIDKMRSFFAARGVTVDSAAGAVAVSSALRASAGSVPSTLANSVLDVALSVSATSTTTSSYLLAKGASKMFMYAKLKLAAGAIAASVLVGGSGVALFAQAGTGAEKPSPASQTPLPAAAANASAVAKLDDGLVVECLGIRRMGDDQQWWYPDGSPSASRCDPPTSTNEPPHSHQMLFRVSGAPDDAGIVYWIQPKRDWSSEEAKLHGAPIEGAATITIPAADLAAFDITCMVATGAWESVLTCEQLDATTCGGGKHGGVIFSPTVNAPNPLAGNQPGAMVTVSHDVSAYQSRVMGVDDNGVEHVARAGNSAMAGSVRQNLYHFDQPVENMRTISFQVRPYDHRATFANITLDPAKKTDVKIKLEKD
ncbi:MAG: sigma-70 family RNA polymerase sigma factor [Anaerolineae bacterium]|nr:sigma-70 family RNA polymerase sigma factor [Phycisphaerae bacterium]